jgi:putative colanic acid biosynthesis UDP-glucose lipid carrier transferase
MTEPVVLRGTFRIASLSALRVAAAPVVAVLTLRGVTEMFGANFDRAFMMLAVLVAVLSTFMLQPPRDVPNRLMPRRGPMALHILLRWLLLLAVLFAIGYATKSSEEFSRRVVLTWAVVTPLLLIVVSVAIDELLRRGLLAASQARKAVIAGFNETSHALAERLARSPELCMTVSGFFDDRSATRLGVGQSQDLLGGLSELPQFVRTRGIDVIFIALPMRHIQRVVDLLDDLKDTTCSIYYLPDIVVFDLIQSRTLDILGIPAVAMCETPFYGYRGVMKRLSDLILASLILVILSPLMLLIALLVRMSTPGPIIFKQRRYGLDGCEIMVFKFRTMTVVEDGKEVRQACRNDHRTTPIGRVLRRYSLDELPQLINVLSGQMSLVGPRPHAVAHNEQYRKLIKGYMLRHKVLPGITGLAQVNGCRGETASLEDMEARIRFDLDYLRNWSPLLDLRILCLTALRLLRDEKAY